MTPKNNGKKWSEDETILAFYYYCCLPFGKLNKQNHEIIRIAQLLGRTPDAVVLKMMNLAHFDPEQAKRNVTGLSNASKLDSEIVSKFYDDWDELTYQAALIEKQMQFVAVKGATPPGLDRLGVVKQRVNQDFFRKAVLAAYGGRCCMTDISVTQLLIASHIKPWRESDPERERANPRNGLLLNALHDKAFDQGLITVLPDFTVRVSSKLQIASFEKGIQWLTAVDHQKINVSSRFAPAKEFLQYHNDVVFVP